MSETHAVLNVPGISCNHCKMAIEGAVSATWPACGPVDVDVAEKSVAVEFDADASTSRPSRRPSRKRATRSPATTSSAPERRRSASRAFGKTAAGWYHIASPPVGR